MSLSKLRQANKELLSKLQNQDNNSRFEDKRIWKPFFDKEKGTGSAIIRFLPRCEAELNEISYAKVNSVTFKHNAKWFIENSLTSLGKQCPISDLKYRLWNSGIASDQDIVKKMKRKETYYANIYVIKDPSRPENEGKVMIYEYGAAIAKLIKEALVPKEPEFDDEPKKESMNPFDVETGADLYIKMVGKEIVDNEGKKVIVPDYEKTKFKEPSAFLDGDEEKIDEVWSKCHPLNSFLSPEKFKSEAQLRKRLVEVFGTHVGSGVPVVNDEVKVEGDKVIVEQKVTTQATKPSPSASNSVQEEDDDMDSLMASLMDD